MFKTPESEKRGRNVDSCSKNITCYLDNILMIHYFIIIYLGEKRKNIIIFYYILAQNLPYVKKKKRFLRPNICGIKTLRSNKAIIRGE